MLTLDTPVFTVSDLNQQVKTLLENSFMTINVTGEVSNLMRASSGHVYFTLKDHKAQIRCAFFKAYQQIGSASLEEGASIMVTGKLSLFEAKGDYQLIVYQVEVEGDGLLYKEFAKLKAKLASQGLFASAHKKPLPLFPHTIGIISSPKGAALRDILITLYNRFHLANVIIYPSEVQGQQAALQLKKALLLALEENIAEIIILARGGGSIEDLWAFNDEALAYTIFNAQIPIVTGIGHETDFTLADFVADVRAATPTAAALAATPDKRHLKEKLARQEQELSYSLNLCLYKALEKLASLKTRLKKIAPDFAAKNQLIDYLEYQLTAQIKHLLLTKNQALALKAQALNTLSPLDTLKRGYAIVLQDAKVILTSKAANSNKPIEVRLAEGALTCNIISKHG